DLERNCEFLVFVRDLLYDNRYEMILCEIYIYIYIYIYIWFYLLMTITYCDSVTPQNMSTWILRK
ncbi:MAG: hypothetical protein N7Q72_07470, partial [Spiroplasma sp. Tabriz.8]|nr:hypothetical protein [Spiroplasma sp. Tabriz.8]